jgi:hypothetical protein
MRSSGFQLEQDMTYTEARKAIRAAKRVFLCVRYTENDTCFVPSTKTAVLSLYKGLKAGVPRLTVFDDGDVVIG